MSILRALTQKTPKIPITIFMVSVGIISIWRIAGDFSGAMGSDSALWGLSSHDVWAGISTPIPPGYPGLISILYALGLPVVTSGWVISTAATASIPIIVFWFARELGANTIPAIIAAIFSLIHPALFQFAHQVQPDAITTLAITALALLWQKERSKTAVILAGILLLFREHALSLWPALLILLGRRFVSFQARLSLIFLLIVVAWIGPILVGQMPGWHPLDTPWGNRTGGALQAFTTTDPQQLSFLRELPREERHAYVELVLNSDRFGQLRWHFMRSIGNAWELWALSLSALCLALGARRRNKREPLWSCLWLTAALPALLIWSQSRHVALLVPIALAIIAASWPTNIRAQFLWIIPLLGLSLLFPSEWRATWYGQKGETIRSADFEEIANWICRESPNGAFLGGFVQDIGLYCRLPRHDPNDSPADWRTFLVSDRPAPTSTLGEWTKVYTNDGPYSVYRLSPERIPRPCESAVIHPDTSHLAIAEAQAHLHCDD